MFQSSRIPSGILPRQASSACSPSSASEISNSSPSRIRRATLRMTLESSTTKQVFIASSFLRPKVAVATHRPHSALRLVRSRRLGMIAYIELPVHVELDQMIAVEAIHDRRDAL